MFTYFKLYKTMQEVLVHRPPPGFHCKRSPFLNQTFWCRDNERFWSSNRLHSNDFKNKFLFKPIILTTGTGYFPLEPGTKQMFLRKDEQWKKLYIFLFFKRVNWEICLENSPVMQPFTVLETQNYVLKKTQKQCLSTPKSIVMKNEQPHPTRSTSPAVSRCDTSKWGGVLGLK